MPNIKEYDAPVNVIHPGNEGFSSWETAGRRLGPAYNQVAQDIRTAGRLQGDTIRSRLWPFDILRLYEDDAKQSQSSPVGFRVRASGRSNSSNGYATDPYADYAQTSRGAADLSSIARETVLRGKPRKLNPDGTVGPDFRGSTQVNPDGTVTPYYESDELAGRDQAGWGDFTLGKLGVPKENKYGKGLVDPNPDVDPTKVFQQNYKRNIQDNNPDRQAFHDATDIYGNPKPGAVVSQEPSVVDRMVSSFRDYVERSVSGGTDASNSVGIND